MRTLSAHIKFIYFAYVCVLCLCVMCVYFVYYRYGFWISILEQTSSSASSVHLDMFDAIRSSCVWFSLVGLLFQKWGFWRWRRRPAKIRCERKRRTNIMEYFWFIKTRSTDRFAFFKLIYAYIRIFAIRTQGVSISIIVTGIRVNVECVVITSNPIWVYE